MLTFKEGKLTFQFNDQWDSIIDYDEQFYSDYIRFFQDDGVTALDFVASRNTATGTTQLFFIEVKDLRGYETNWDTKNKMANNAMNLTNTTARNIRDTVYGIVLGSRKPKTINYEKWQEFLNTLKDESSQMVAVLWLEANLSVLPAKPTHHAMVREFKRKLSKFTRQVWVCDRSDNPIPGLNVYDNS